MTPQNAQELGKNAVDWRKSSEVSPTQRWRCHLGRVEEPTSPFAFTDSESFQSGSKALQKRLRSCRSSPRQGWEELRTWCGGFSVFCCSVLLPQSSAVQHICSSRSPTQLFLLGVSFLKTFYPNFTLQTSSFNSPTENQVETLHPLLVPRHRGTTLPPQACAQWKETGRD